MRTLALCSAARAWKCGGAWSSKYMVIVMPMKVLMVGMRVSFGSIEPTTIRTTRDGIRRRTPQISEPAAEPQCFRGIASETWREMVLGAGAGSGWRIATHARARPVQGPTTATALFTQANRVCTCISARKGRED